MGAELPLWRREALGSKGFGEGGPRPLREARRKEESIEHRKGKGREQTLSCNLLLFQDPELPEGEALFFGPGLAPP